MTTSEENYIKVIYHLSLVSPKGVNTNAIAGMLVTKASSVTDMLKKLSEKELVAYQKYQGVTLTESGLLSAKMIVRKHRLWEVFLVEKLNFSWDEVHEIAEELEHIQSEKLINKLDEFLDFPTFDPHGDPIPDKNGEIAEVKYRLLTEANTGEKVIFSSVGLQTHELMNMLKHKKIALGDSIEILEKYDFDQSLDVLINTSEMDDEF